MPTITGLHAREIVDSRGTPTIEVTLSSDVITVVASVPSGKSAGSREACELRDEDGRGVTRALARVNETISSALIGSTLDLGEVDRRLLELDGTENKTFLGANAMLGVSVAALRASAASQGVPPWKLVSILTGSTPGFPRLYMNMINGGAHASFRLPFQEYIVAVGARGASEAYAKASAIFDTLGELMGARYGSVPMGDEGGYSPEFSEIEKPFELLTEASGGEADVFLAIDAAASEFYHDGKYTILGKECTALELLDVYRGLTAKFRLESIEDPFDESDFSAFENMTAAIGEKILVVGDDLTVTNPKLVHEMSVARRANAMIIKPNQVGTMTEVFETVRLAREAGWKLIASHRSGETEDTFIADVAVGIGAYGLKAGAPTQKERRVKYERLRVIEGEMRSLGH